MNIEKQGDFYKLTVESIPNRGTCDIYLTKDEYKELFQTLLDELLKNI